MFETDVQQIAHNLRVIMASRNLTARELSKRSEISQGTIGYMLAGNQPPSTRTLGKLATALGVNVTDFYRQDLINLRR